MKVRKWGNNLAVRLPDSAVKALQLQEGDELDVQVVNGNEISVSRKPTPEELIERLRAFQGMLPADFKLDYDEANDR